MVVDDVLLILETQYEVTGDWTTNLVKYMEYAQDII